MAILVGAITVLGFIFIALSVLFRRLSPREAGTRMFGIVVFLVFAPVLVTAGFNVIREAIAPLLFGFVVGVVLVVVLAGAVFFCAAYLLRFTR